MTNGIIEPEKIKEALTILLKENNLFEVRILKGKTTISGYFTSSDVLLNEFNKVDLRGANVFYTLHRIDESCYSREQHDCFRQVKTTTSDNDIVAYQWLLIDLDPVRRTGISSTDAELRMAYERGEQITKYLREIGYPAPIFACSGNGVHLLYAINLANTDENKALVQNCLKALAFLFGDDKVDVDQSVFNPARISKLYGTMAQKGANTKERPHRMSRILSAPKQMQVVSRELLEKLAADKPIESAPTKESAKSSFDIVDWMDRYSLRYEVKEWKDATRYVLDHCPFDSSHTGTDAVIMKHPNGAIQFKCFHNSCQGHDWRELRLMYEPDAYDDKRAEDEARIEEGWKQYKAYNRNRTDIAYQEEQANEEHIEKVFETAMDILQRPVEERICIQTGMEEFDKKTGGLAKGEITLVSGLRASGKSSLISQWALNAVNQDYTTIIYSGELKDTRLMGWIYQQAAGPDFVVKHKTLENFWYCRDDVKPAIAKWLGDRFWLYNNNYGNNFKMIATKLSDIIRRLKADLVIIDNMSILDLSDITDDRRADKWDQQKLFVETLKNLAMLCNCHIVFVVHPRKANGFLRLDDVGGSGSIGNLADNVFIVHRVNRDFLRGFRRDVKGIPDNARNKDEDEVYYDLGGDNCVEIVKERETGIQDLFIPLWFETSTKRLKNGAFDNVIYKWDFDGFIGREEIPFEDGGDADDN